MKKTIFLLMTLLTVSSIGFAADYLKSEKSPASTSQVKSISIDLGDISNLTTCEIAQSIDASIELSIAPVQQLQCTFTFSASAKFGAFTISATATVTGDCSAVKAAARDLVYQAIDDAKAYLSGHE